MEGQREHHLSPVQRELIRLHRQNLHHQNQRRLGRVTAHA